jgi:hypothetical protein
MKRSQINAMSRQIGCIVLFLVVFGAVAYVATNLAVTGVIWFQQFWAESVPAWFKWTLAAIVLVAWSVAAKAPGKKCHRCYKQGWFLAPGWHQRYDIAMARTYRYCPACWAADEPSRRKTAEAARLRAAEMKVKAEKYPKPSGKEVNELRGLVQRLSNRAVDFKLLDSVTSYLHKYGPNLPQALLKDIEDFTWRGFRGHREVGYQKDDETGYEWVKTGELEPCHVDTQWIARLAREALEMQAAQRG